MKKNKLIFPMIMIALALVGCEPSKEGETDIKLKDADGNIYKTTKIGSQIWMAENIRKVVVGSYCLDNDAANCLKFGRLYTWSQAQKVCPEGWHLPSKEDFEIMSNYLDIYIQKRIEEKKTRGMPLHELEREDFDENKGEIKGLYLRSCEWNDGLDELGFNAVNSGFRSNGFGKLSSLKSEHDFYDNDENGLFLWTSTIKDDGNTFFGAEAYVASVSCERWGRCSLKGDLNSVEKQNEIILRGGNYKNRRAASKFDLINAYSVRCVRDKRVEIK